MYCHKALTTVRLPNTHLHTTFLYQMFYDPTDELCRVRNTESLKVMQMAFGKWNLVFVIFEIQSNRGSNIFFIMRFC